MSDLWETVESPTQRRLLTAGVEAFGERGFHGTSTRDIAARAGLSPAALYVHYRTKELLLFDISRIGQAEALAALERAVAPVTEPVERIRTMVAHFAEWHARNHALARVIHHELPALTPEHRAESAVTRRRIEKIFRDAVAAGVTEKTFHVADVADAALALLSLTIDICRWWGQGRPRSARKLAEHYAELAVGMLESKE
ncbi:TetR/AcrR family transcriptional regulator [Actinoplanes sp. CA-142083]|uniref:TetR/AcrR family transcriptional regulator n=1 Tax=Actinoplanes sp. CA-142083 TaxID=3239903 RepID=UPI003D8B70EB